MNPTKFMWDSNELMGLIFKIMGLSVGSTLQVLWNHTFESRKNHTANQVIIRTLLVMAGWIFGRGNFVENLGPV